MKKNKVEEIGYENIYQFSCQSENIEDFVDRLQIVSSIIIDEFSRRLDKHKPKTLHKVALIIDQYNLEIVSTIKNINSTNIIENQPPILDNILISLIAINSPRLYNDYIYVKKIFPN